MPSSLIEFTHFLVLTVLFVWWMGKWQFVKSIGFDSLQIRALFTIKLLAGVGLSVLYEKVYGDRMTSDAFRFFDDAKIIAEQFWVNPAVYFKIILGLDTQNADVLAVLGQLNNWFKIYHHGVFNDNQTIIRFNALLLPISQGYYYVHIAVVNLVAFSGVMALLLAIKRLFFLKKYQLITVFLFPQFIFWTSGVLKEALMVAFFGWFMLELVQIYQNGFSKLRFVWLVLFAGLMLTVKSYLLLCMIPGITLLFVAKLVPVFKNWKVGLGLIGLQLASVVLADFASGSSKAASIYQKQHDFINVALMNNSGSYFESFALEPTWLSIISNAPEALLNSLTRPLLWNINNFMMLFSSLENILVIVFLLLALVFRTKKLAAPSEAVLLLLSSSILLYVLVGLITPVSGALVRYKIPVLPFILTLGWIILDVKRLPLVGKPLSKLD